MTIQPHKTSRRGVSRALRNLMLGGALALLSAQAAQAEWRRAETDNFVVYGEGGEGDLRRQAEQLERFDALLRLQFGLPPVDGVRKLPVYLVRTRAELRELRPRLPERVGGFYSASPIDVYAALNRRSGQHVLFHEYAHHFMHQNFPGVYPGWFIEGFAEFFATATVDDAGKVEVGYYSPGRLANLNALSWLPMDQLLSVRPNQLEGRARAAFYAQSWLLTHYLFSDPERRRGLDGYLAAVGRGTPYEQALKDHLNHTPDSLNDALRAYLRGRMPYSRLDMAEVEPQVQLTVLPDSADRMLLYGVSLRYAKTPEEMARLLPRVRADAARYPDDRLALVTLGRAELRGGDAAAGEAALKRALEIAPGDVEALQTLAWIRLDASKTLVGAARGRLIAEAQAYLAEAMRTDPTDYRTYVALARARSVARDYPNENDVATLKLAQAYAPQVLGLRMQTADALRRTGRAEEADALMAAVANYAHEGASPPTPDTPETPDTPSPEQPASEKASD